MATAAPSEDALLRIAIKNPTDRPSTPPFTISVAPCTTIAALKQTLSSTYPGSPLPTAQRLIYAGKLLPDNVMLSALITNPLPSMTHTLHLVISTPHIPSSSSATTAAPPPIIPPAIPATIPTPPALPNALPNAPPANALQPPNLPYYYNPYFPPFAHAPNAAFPLPLAYPPPPTDVPLDHAAYAQHLQAVEQLIAQTLHNLPPNLDAAQRQQIAAQMNAASAAVQAQMAAHNAQPQAMNAQNVQNAQNAQNGQNQPQNNAPQQPLPGMGINVPNGIGFDFRIQRQNQGNPPRVRQFVFQFELNWSLITKLAIVVYLLGQEGNPTRVYTLIGVAVLVYLWQIGHLSFLSRFVSNILPNPRRLIELLFPPLPTQNAAQNDPNADQNPPQNDPTAPMSDTHLNPNPPRHVPRFARLAVLISFIYSFVYGFICSLLPAWNPEPLPRIQDLLDRNQQQQQQQQQDPDAHEHAD